MRVVFRESAASGIIAAPPSKSMAHRLLICAGLAPGESVINNIDRSQDILATIDCLEALGASISLDGGRAVVRGTCPAEQGEGAVLPCRESGSTMRFFLPLCLLGDPVKRLTGSERLMERPLSIYEKICAEQKLLFQKDAAGVRAGGRLAAGEYTIDGAISSQFVSGLLFALPLLGEQSLIKLVPPVESRPYIDMTLEALGLFGVQAGWAGENAIAVHPGRYRPCEATVEGDYSNAAFFEALNLAGGNVTVTGLCESSNQGDRIYKSYFSSIIQQRGETLDLSDCPDLAPVLFAAAAICGGGSFSGTARLRHKESDRGAAMAAELAKFGITADVGQNSVTIRKGELKKPTLALFGHNDHRIVMALSVLLAITGGELLGAQAVEKSLPDFFDRLERLGVSLSVSGRKDDEQ